MNELKEWWHALLLAPRRKHVVCEMVMIVLPPVVRPEEDLDGVPSGLDVIGVVPSVRIDEVDGVVDGAVRETLCVEIAVRTPAVADDRGAWFDPVMYNGHQGVSCSVRYGNKKCSSELSFNTTKHPLTLNRVFPMVLSPTELAFVTFDGLVGTTDFFRAALHEHQHGFPAEHAPISGGT